jgi:hypothetical protein
MSCAKPLLVRRALLLVCALLQQYLLRQKFAPPDAGASRLESTWGASRVEPPDALGRIEFVLIYCGGGAAKA